MSTVPEMPDSDEAEFLHLLRRLTPAKLREVASEFRRRFDDANAIAMSEGLNALANAREMNG
ncbi:hypothetical protein [Mesorhizobium silamurunense]|uniref:hypothetical protein n=1 Tax=Mesorhizobium silamurunense TaxID=499528 RepID=UPI001783A6F9|nr:hypothetical protein [Mesorhizobium silamurunense]